MKYIIAVVILTFICCWPVVESTKRNLTAFKLTNSVLRSRRSSAIDTSVDDIKDATAFSEREKKWKELMKEGDMLPEHTKSSKKAEIPHLEETKQPEPEMVGKTRTEEDADSNEDITKADDFDGTPTIADEETDGESGASGSGDVLKSADEEETDSVNDEEEYEPEKENNKVGKRRGSMKCERRCSVPLDYHECAHPRCDTKVGTIKDLCFYLCKNQKQRCEDVCE